MAMEIERKFLVDGDFKTGATGAFGIAQGYLNSDADRTVRIRLLGNRGFITVKGRSSDSGMSRFEWETEIPCEDARELLRLCEPGIIEKTRYTVAFSGHVFEVDEFHGDNEGLVLAEIELGAEDEEFERPGWLGMEVTGDDRYYNSALASDPYKNWKPLNTTL